MSVLSKALQCAVLVAVASGCAVNSASKHSADVVTSDAALVAQVADSAGINSDTPIPLEMQEIVSAADAGVGLRLERADGYTRLIVQTGIEQPQVDVLALEDPARLVVDLLGEGVTVNSAYAIEHDDFLKAVRLGMHDDRARIVLDLTDLASDPVRVDQSVETGGRELLITFTEQAVERDVASLEPVLSPNEEAIVAADEHIESSERALSASTEQEGMASSSVALDQSPVAEDTGNALVLGSVKLAPGDGDGSKVIVGLSSEAAYEMVQTTPTEFVLRIPGANAADEAKFPLITSAEVSGIRTARVVQQDDVAVVRMFVDAGVELRALPKGSDIEISAHPSVSKPVVDATARAQMLNELADEESDEQAAGAQAGDTDDSDLGALSGIRSSDGTKVYVGRLISLDLQDTDIDNALRIIAEVSNLNIIAADDVSGKVTLRLIDVPWDQALDVILKTNGLGQVAEGNVIRIAPIDKLRQEREALREAKRALEELEDLSINYIRISYARAVDIQEQVESVLSERGVVSVDERTNQLIIKDIQKGQEAVMELTKKLDLRTPQVLLETQIVESSRGLLRDLGFQWNFSYSQAPATGNATGLNFPNSITAGGGTFGNGETQSVNFPAVLTDAAGSAVSAVLDSADGSRALTARLSTLETEGKVRVISRPQVATVNNEQAEIKSVETVRIRLPDSGLSVATGSGASASGGGSSAFEEINVGIELRVTPQASPDYYVLLDIEARSSTFGDTLVDNIPSTLEREATSTILVKSGQTFALGGVYRIEDNSRVEGVPFLKDIPFLGHFFRRSLLDNGDEELIFFITPHIVEGSFDASLM